MSERNVSEETTPADRLRIARQRRGYASASAAAAALKIPVGTYLQHEGGLRNIPPKKADLYAKEFHVTPEYLLYGREETSHVLAKVVPLCGKIGPNGVVEEYLPRDPRRRHVEAPTIPEGATAAFEVLSPDALGPFFVSSFVFVGEPVEKPSSEHLGRPCLIRRKGDSVMRIIYLGEHGKVHLSGTSFVQPEFNQAIINLAKVIGVRML